MRSYQQQQKRGEVPGGEKIEQKELSKVREIPADQIWLSD